MFDVFPEMQLYDFVCPMRRVATYWSGMFSVNADRSVFHPVVVQRQQVLLVWVYNCVNGPSYVTIATVNYDSNFPSFSR